ncbi:MAG: hypothetical protein WCL10_01395 [Novosphingobium sp.]|uniref:hypothetical protein n=1 Tax=Novosphingobium sp. TaxID=1874826 RepID=UPI0030178184
MIALRQRLFRHRNAAMILLALAFALRALIPQSIMAAPDAARGITVLLCDGSGPAARIVLPMGEKPAKPAAQGACPFAVLAQAALGIEPNPWTLGPAAPRHLIRVAASTAFRLSGATRHHPPARGPPAAV